MVWGAVIAAGASLIGAKSSKDSADKTNSLAKKELAFKREQAEIMNRLRNQIFAQAEGAFEKEDEIFDYIMNLNDRNQSRVQEFFNYSRAFAQQDQAYRRQEQEFEKYRIDSADQLAAEERARQLQKLVDDEGIAAGERERALDELEYVQSIARGERQYDIKQYESDQAMSQLEYQYRVQQYENLLGIVNEERQYEIDRQQRIMREANMLRDTIDETLASFGDLPLPKRYGESDIQSAESEFYQGFLSDADRAADRIASVNEAGLIRGGVDQSTTGDSSRRELLQTQIIPLYQTARNRARQEALQYVSGLQENEANAFNTQVGARAAAIDEQLRGNTAMIDVLNNLDALPSAARNDFLQLGSQNIGPRGLTSAGGFRAPINIGSGVLDRDITAEGMDRLRALNTSRAGGFFPTADGVFTPNIPNFTSAGSLYSTAMGGGGYDSDFATLAEMSRDAGNAATQNFMNFANQLGGIIDEANKDKE